MQINAQRWHAWIAREIEADATAMRCGVSHITISPTGWQQRGCPTAVRLSNGTNIPVTPTGRKADHMVTWYYKRNKPRRRR